MFKQRWFLALTAVLMLSLALLTFAHLENRQPTTLSHDDTTKQPGINTCSNSGANAHQKSMLIFSKTAGFRHESIPAAIVALKKLAAENNVLADFTEDATVFTDTNLARYDAIVFLLTTGHILNDSQQVAFERYIRAGGGYAGVHSASDTEYDWPWYGRLVGAYFNRITRHSSVVQATIHMVDHTHPSTVMLPSLWIRTDEWYNFATNPRGSVDVLMTIDEKTYKGGTMGTDHPIAWYHEYGGGRAWYTALGHTSESYSEPLFLAHLWGGISYALGSGCQ